MDKRLALELAPGPAFLIGNAIGGIFLGAGLATFAIGLSILLRWRWDRTLPWMGISIFGLTIILLIAGLFFDDTTFVKISNTLGSVAFAAIIAVGQMSRPSLLERTLEHSVRMTSKGWRQLHFAWVSISLARGAANEFVWRFSSDKTWALYNGLSDVAWIGAFFLATSLIAHRNWEDRD